MAAGDPVWRLIIDEARTGATNMAIDETLFESVQAGGRPVLRLYHWNPPCLSLGRNQVADRSIAARAAARGAQVVRRPTGGLAVYHDREVTYAVIGPVTLLGRPREAYARINRALVAAIRGLGAPATLAAGARRAAAPATSAGLPCFAAAAAGEVMVRDRKLVGSAQRCVAHVILQHGSILLDGDQTAADVRVEAAAVAVPASMTLREAIGRAPAREDVRARVVRAFEEEFGIVFIEDAAARSETERSRALAARYASEAWTWRR